MKHFITHVKVYQSQRNLTRTILSCGDAEFLVTVNSLFAEYFRSQIALVNWYVVGIDVSREFRWFKWCKLSLSYACKRLRTDTSSKWERVHEVSSQGYDSIRGRLDLSIWNNFETTCLSFNTDVTLTVTVQYNTQLQYSNSMLNDATSRNVSFTSLCSVLIVQSSGRQSYS
jgi:hypothetical protein